MKTNALNLAKLALLPAAILTLASCESDSPPPPTESTSIVMWLTT
jgi:hypothetical protein